MRFDRFTERAQAVPYGVIDTKGKYYSSVVIPPMFTYGLLTPLA